MAYETIIYEETDHIGRLTLNRPQCINALNRRMIEELEILFEELAHTSTARVLVIEGAGDKGFCAGLDMKETAATLFGESLDVIYYFQSRTSRLFHTMRCLPQPIIAAVHGAASGAGFSFAMAADVRIVTPGARFNAAYINIGLGGADLASSYFLPRLIGAGRAHEFLLTGDFMTAEEAIQLGFASRLAEKEQLLSSAVEMGLKMASKNPLGLKMTKEAINQNLGVTSLEQALHLENRNQAFLIAGMKLDAQKA